MTQPCGHDEKWLTYSNPVDLRNSERHCLFCEVEQLRAIVSLLRKTKDGRPVVPHHHTRLWYVHPKGEIYERTYEANMDDARSHRDAGNNVVWVSVEDCYSTREAAEAARSEA
jgi:hypothetical protein